VAEAYEIGTRQAGPDADPGHHGHRVSFNPFAQSPVGAQGLMQVMTRVHTDKYEALGGHLAAFDPVTNLRVGVKVLQDCITRAGSIGGLAYYVGAANPRTMAATPPRCWPNTTACARSHPRAGPCRPQAVAPPTLATQPTARRGSAGPAARRQHPAVCQDLPEPKRLRSCAQQAPGHYTGVRNWR
jgi:hypothetical protein